MGNSRYKFRAWHHGGGDPRVIGAMYFSHPYNEMFWGRIDNEPHSVEVMQYTGRRDKNGTDIYEGDICKGAFDKKYIVRFIIDGWCLDAGVTPRMHDYICEHGNILEVIGNIHANPELLEKS